MSTTPETTKKNSGSHAAPPEVASILPLHVGNPAAAGSFAIDQKHMEDFVTNVEAEPSVVECRRPPKGVFFTVLPEQEGTPYRNRGFYFLLTIEGQDPYLVAPAIAEEKKGEEDTIRPVLIVRYTTMAGVEGLWPIKLDPPDRKSNRWNASAMNILRIAESGRWVRLLSAKGEYRYNVSKKTFDQVPPRFTDRPFQGLVENHAFRERTVATSDHPVWDELENGSTK